MKASNKNVVRKRPGRPATGQDPVTAIRLSAELRGSIDVWATTQDDLPGRSEAIRRLVELGLMSSKAPSRPTAAKGAARAVELAASVIEKHIDASAPAEEREARKRRLLKGPSAFREVRVDRAKAKK